MKHILSLALILSFLHSFSQESVIEKSKQLIDNKKYESAFQLLDKADPSNEIPEIALAKTNLVLHYFVSSLMHQMFALKDLKPEQDIMDIRGKEGQFSMHKFLPDSVLIPLTKKFPDNYKLYKEIGYYYHEVYSKYSDKWLVADSVLIEKFKSNYLQAYNHGIMDYWSAYGIGYAYILNQKYQLSIPYFKKSIELNSEYPTSYYNLAYSYLYTNQREKSIESAKKALALYQDSQYKADAARMIAVIYRELKEDTLALDYYHQADEIDPHNYYTLKPLLEMELALNKGNYNERTLEFFKLAPENPTIYQDLLNNYQQADKIDELLKFLESQHTNYQKQFKVDGNLYFYTAVIQYNKGNFTEAKTNFALAREIFKKVFAANHRVFEIINAQINNCNQNS